MGTTFENLTSLAEVIFILFEDDFCSGEFQNIMTHQNQQMSVFTNISLIVLVCFMFKADPSTPASILNVPKVSRIASKLLQLQVYMIVQKKYIVLISFS